VTLDDLATMIKEGGDFVVYDAKTGEDITRSVLTQIIVEQEQKGENRGWQLPQQLIGFTATACNSWCPATSSRR